MFASVPPNAQGGVTASARLCMVHTFMVESPLPLANSSRDTLLPIQSEKKEFQICEEGNFFLQKSQFPPAASKAGNRCRTFMNFAQKKVAATRRKELHCCKKRNREMKPIKFGLTFSPYATVWNSECKSANANWLSHCLADHSQKEEKSTFLLPGWVTSLPDSDSTL